jgi:soluble lytic murein transglycosylase
MSPHHVASLLIVLVLASLPLATIRDAAARPTDPKGKAPPVAEVEPAPPPAPEPPRFVVVQPEDRGPILDLPTDLRDALRQGQWTTAAQRLAQIPIDAQPGRRKGTLAFLRAWALVHAGRAAEAAPLLGRLDGADGVPDDHLALARAEILLATGEPLAATQALATIAPDSPIGPRAMLVRASALRKLERMPEAFAIYEELAAQADPAPGAPEALLALARRAGVSSPAAYPLLRRIWEQYPKTPISVESWPALKAHGKNPTWQEQARRAYALMRAGHLDDARAESLELSPPAGDRTDPACVLLFTKGRTAYRKNQLSAAVTAFGDIGPRCTDASDDWGARGLYLQGLAQFRRGAHLDAAKTLASIPALYPKSSVADDGFLHAGIALQDAGQLDEARKLWLRALDEIPEGDTTPESTWRLAWSHYLDGQPARAVAVADRLALLPLTGDRRHVESGRYWAARWRLYPDVAQPTVASTTPGARAEAVARWAALCRDLPHSYYSVLAYSRLVEVAPDEAAALRARPPGHERATSPAPWHLRPEFAADPGIRDGVALARLGLGRDARAAWDRARVGPALPDEHAWLYELRIQTGDWLFTHDAMRGWIEHNPPGTLGDRQPWVIRTAYPDRYWDLVQDATKGYRYEPRLFHALVREESNFNHTIRSPVGAIGLSQLMPYTAKETAGWMKIPVGDLDDPANNLKIGARYLESVLGGASGSPYLALAAYNAGPGRVKEWIGRWGNVPSDEYVERIPFRETRGYVRRVTTTWQTYRFQFDEGDAFPDLSKFNHQAKP